MRNHLVLLNSPEGAHSEFSMSLFGLPILPSECLPSLGTAGDVMLCDFSAYIVALNKQITVDASPHYAFPSDLTTYRLTYLAAGKPQLEAPITLLGGGTVSPFVHGMLSPREFCRKAERLNLKTPAGETLLGFLVSMGVDTSRGFL